MTSFELAKSWYKVKFKITTSQNIHLLELSNLYIHELYFIETNIEYIL